MTLISQSGCGAGVAGDSTAPERRPAVAAEIDTAGSPDGPRDPGGNLERLIVASSPSLSQVTVRCPALPDPIGYPFRCRLEAVAGPGREVAGEVTVFGVYRPSRSYAFELRYRPVGSR